MYVKTIKIEVMVPETVEDLPKVFTSTTPLIRQAAESGLYGEAFVDCYMPDNYIIEDIDDLLAGISHVTGISELTHIPFTGLDELKSHDARK